MIAKKRKQSSTLYFKYLLILTFFLITTASASTSNNDISDSAEHITTFRFFGDGQVAAFSLDLSLLSSSNGDKLEYGFNVMPFSFARQNGNYQYAFQMPINLLSILCSMFLTKTFIDDSITIDQSPFTYALMLPNSHLRYKLHRNFKLTLGTNTEYLLYRDDEGYRGIQFAPFLGITYIHWGKEGWVGATLHVTSTNFLNFDGGNPRRRIQLGIRLYSRIR